MALPARAVARGAWRRPGGSHGVRTGVAIQPSVGVAWFRQAEIAFKDGRLDDAAAAYDRARDAPPEAPFLPPGVTSRQTMPLSVYARLGLVRVALERRHLDAASREVRTIVDAYPTAGPARGLLREVERAAGTSGATAGRGFETPYVPPADPRLDGVVAASRHSDVLLKHAGLATRGGDHAWREFLVSRALESNPDDLNVLMEMSALRQAQRRYAEALEYLRRHERLAPGDHHTLVQQGRVLADLGRPAEAEAVLRRAVLVRDATAEFNLGTVLDQQDRWAEARVHYERALAIDPFQTRAMNNLAAGLDHNGQSAAALGLFERAIAIAPDTADYYVNYGNALIGSRRLDDAIRALATAIRLDPRAANAHNNMGIALARQGNLPGARDAFARALEIDPRHESARANLAQVTAAQR